MDEITEKFKREVKQVFPKTTLNVEAGGAEESEGSHLRKLTPLPCSRGWLCRTLSTPVLPTCLLLTASKGGASLHVQGGL